MGTHPKCVQTPNMMSHSGFWTRSESDCGSRSDSHLVSSASLISDSVRWRMKTGLPRHLIMTWLRVLVGECEWWRDIARGTYVLALGDGSEIDFNLGLGEHVGRCGHVDEEVCTRMMSVHVLVHQFHLPAHPQNSQLLSSSFLVTQFLHVSSSTTLRSAIVVWVRRTLHSRLRAKRRQRTHGANHKVLEHLGARLAALIPVRGK
jgi:hypothetical protein